MLLMVTWCTYFRVNLLSGGRFREPRLSLVKHAFFFADRAPSQIDIASSQEHRYCRPDALFLHSHTLLHSVVMPSFKERAAQFIGYDKATTEAASTTHYLKSFTDDLPAKVSSSPS